MAMTGRFVNYGARVITTAAMLLLAIISSPMGLSKPTHSASNHGKLSRKFALRGFVQSGRVAKSPHLSISGTDTRAIKIDIADELEADIEDELTVIVPPTSVTFDALPSPSPNPHSKPISIANASVFRVIRC